MDLGENSMSKFTKLLLTLLFIFLIEIILIYRGCKTTNLQISDTPSFAESNPTLMEYKILN
jgi:hypothetical protein